MNAFKKWLETPCCICGEPITKLDAACIASKVGCSEPAHCDCVDDVIAELNQNAIDAQVEWEASR